MYIRSMCIYLQFYLSAIADHVDPRVKSATISFQRPVSTGTQTYGTNPNNYPITQPMTKMTALLQVKFIILLHITKSTHRVCIHINICALDLRWSWVHNRCSHPAKRMCCSLCALNPSKVYSACVLGRHHRIVDYFQGNAKITGIDFSSAKVDVSTQFEFHFGSIKSSMSFL